MTKPWKTQAITHSAVFTRIFRPDTWSPTLLCATLNGELVHGVAAQDAFVAMFDEFGDFDDMAREATQQRVPRTEARPSEETRQRQKTRRIARRQLESGTQASMRPLPQSKHQGQTRAAQSTAGVVRRGRI